MSKSRHTEAQMIAALKQLEADRRAEDGPGTGRIQAHDLCLKAKYGGMEASEAEEVKLPVRLAKLQIRCMFWCMFEVEFAAISFSALRR